MKWVRRIVVVLLVLVVVLAVVANVYLGSLVKVMVEKAGPSVVGVPLQLEKAEFRLLRGFVRLKGFVLGNPEGFQSESAIRVGEVVVELNMRSLLTDTVVIKRIYVKAPEITYELGLGKSNIGKILEQMGGEGTEAKETSKPAPKEGGKKVVIEDFLIEDGMVRLSAKVAMGVAAPLPLPSIHMTDIGKEAGGQGASPVQVIRSVFGEVFRAITELATGSVKRVGEGVEAVGKGAGKAAGAVGEGAGKLLGGLKGIVPGGKGK